MWNYEYTAIADVDLEEIWNHYQETDTWNQWDAGIASVSLRGPFQNGTEGTLLQQGNTVPFWLEQVEKHRSFSVMANMSHTNVKIEFSHVLQKQKEGLHITHGIVLEGAEAKKWGEIIGHELSKDIPAAVSRLVHLCGGVIK
ncbi:hypothetical protein DFO69_3376 [Bacillus subtilis]|uniref:Polyketide cyclase n=1 Tax=Bacillus inaquosorum KCTC 13429 TaxID=1236548 RepID=A0A9W5PC17_9BACI|nr:hypothetical protein BSI_32280 [Bacillus inaquosorum KCTC 13429]TDO09428.1 hypothetical protein DFO69_3376 [Bacillus subtilis]